MQDNNNNSNSPANPPKPAWGTGDSNPAKSSWGCGSEWGEIPPDSTWGTTANKDAFSKIKPASKTSAYPDFPEPVTVVPTYIDPPRQYKIEHELKNIHKELKELKKRVFECKVYMSMTLDKRIDLVLRNQASLFEEIQQLRTNSPPSNSLPEPKQKPQDQQEPLEEQEKEHNEEEDIFERLMVINLPDDNPEAPAVEVLNDLLEGINEVEIPDGPDAHQIMKTKYIKQLLKLIINSPQENLEKYEKIWNEATGLLPKVVLHLMGRPDDYVDYYLEALRVFNFLDGE